MKVIKNIIPAIIGLIVIMYGGGCEKMTVDTDYIFEPFVQLKAVNGTTDTLIRNHEDIIVYIFMGMDTSVWQPTSYEMAVNGNIENLITAEKKKSNIWGDYTKEGEDITFTYTQNNEEVTEIKKLIRVKNITNAKLIIVACDRNNEIYAFKQADLLPNMDEVWMTVIFKPLYKDNWKYKDRQNWLMVNEAAKPEDYQPEEEEDAGEGEEGDK